LEEKRKRIESEKIEKMVIAVMVIIRRRE